MSRQLATMVGGGAHPRAGLGVLADQIESQTAYAMQCSRWPGRRTGSSLSTSLEEAPPNIPAALHREWSEPDEVGGQLEPCSSKLSSTLRARSSSSEGAFGNGVPRHRDVGCHRDRHGDDDLHRPDLSKHLFTSLNGTLPSDPDRHRISNIVASIWLLAVIATIIVSWL